MYQGRNAALLAALVLVRVASASSGLPMKITFSSVAPSIKAPQVTAVPSSVLGMFMAIITLALLAYVSSDQVRLAAARDKVVTFITDSRYTVPLVLVLVALPLLVAWQVYVGASQSPQPPLSSRTIHPVPPTTITVNGTTIDLVADDNPFRPLKESDPNAFAEHVANGRRLYYENCFYCHGDDLRGDGMFAHGLNPIPTNFADAGAIALLQESFLFWRIAKGGPGLPEEGGPWDTAMPAWENFLTEEEMWDVILFLYDFSEQRPRAREAVHE